MISIYMFEPNAAFSGFSVKDLDETKEFYTKTLGLKLEDEKMGLQFVLPGGGKIFIYPKDNHQPATFTVLNFVVDDIDKAVGDLTEKGIKFEQYNMKEMHQDEKGIARGIEAHMGPDIAWFQDPSGNILSVLQEK